MHRRFDAQLAQKILDGIYTFYLTRLQVFDLFSNPLVLGLKSDIIYGFLEGKTPILM